MFGYGIGAGLEKIVEASPIGDIMSDDFSEHPLSITEVRSQGTENAKDMHPRDALIMALRNFDAGEYGDVDAVVVCLRRKTEDGTRAHFCNAGPDIDTSIGLLTRVKNMLMNP